MTTSEPTTNITIDKQVPGYWRATLDNPPINTVHDRMYDEVFDLVEAIEAEPALKVITFESANPATRSRGALLSVAVSSLWA
jgi:enoyl-CoA hydratase/carnithine racemase